MKGKSIDMKSMILLILAYMLLSASNAAHADAILDTAKMHIAEEQFGKAYAALSPLADERAGDPNFDYLFGIAALDSGNLTEAIFAFERVLTLQPDNAGARAELARAHLRLGELEQAKYEFESVKRADVPDSVSKSIDDYLAAIEASANSLKTAYRVYIQTGLGWDENVNSASDDSQIALPALGGLLFSINDAFQETDSGIWNLRAGFGFTTPVGTRNDLRFFGRMDIDQRTALQEARFSRRTIDANGGFHWSNGPHQIRIAAQVQRFYVGGDPNRDLFGGTLQWQYALSESTQLTAFGQAAALRYPDQEVRDADRFTGGLGIAHAYDVKGRPVVFLSLYGGTEDEVEESRPDLGRDLYGVRLGGQYSFSPRLVAYGNLSYEDSEYGGPDPLFLEEREDEFFDVAFGFRYAVDRHWSITPEIRYNNNDSTLPINEYDRVSGMIYVRNDF